jgi:hypothetical protein
MDLQNEGQCPENPGERGKEESEHWLRCFLPHIRKNAMLIRCLERVGVFASIRRSPTALSMTSGGCRASLLEAIALIGEKNYGGAPPTAAGRPTRMWEAKCAAGTSRLTVLDANN